MSPCKVAGKHQDPVHCNCGSNGHIWICLACETQIAGRDVFTFDELGAFIEYIRFLRGHFENKKAAP